MARNRPPQASCWRLLAAVLVSACRPGVPTPGPRPAEPCNLAGDQTAADTVAVALDGALSAADAPVPANDAERVAFPFMYQTLLAVDCGGAVGPGLAAGWQSPDGRRWTLTLDSARRFTDGRPLTANAVKQSWLAHEGRAARPWRDSVAGSVEVLDAWTLVVTLAWVERGAPRALADPTLAIAGAPAGNGWPAGTRTYVPVRTTDGTWAAAPVRQMRRDAMPVIVWQRSDDPRDALDADVGLLVTRRRAAVEYAATRSEYVIHPLPWDRVYVLAAPSRRAASGAAPKDLSAAVRDGARPPQGDPWWRSGDCGWTGGALPAARATRSRIVYPRGDESARDLAERLVALNGASQLDALVPQAAAATGPVTAQGLDATQFAAAWRRGEDLAYVFALPTRALDPCVAARSVTRGNEWLDPSELGVVLVPLAETRANAVVRGGTGRLVVGWDGLPRPAGLEP